MTKKIQIGSKPITASPSVTADAWVEKRAIGEAENIKRLTIDLPETLHRKIKADCALRGTKMAEEIRELLLQKYGKA
jgi:hypothetical protein